MKFVLNRNYTLASTCGRSVEFQRGVPVHVVPEMHAEVMAIGAQPEGELTGATIAHTFEPSDPLERKAVIFAGFTALAERNSREDFTAVGLPQARALTAQIGFEVEPRDRAELWSEFVSVRAADAAKKIGRAHV